MKTWMLGAVLVLLLIVPEVVWAQSAVGARAGMRWSELETSQSTGSVESLVLGGYFGFGVSNRLAIQIEGVYGTRGGRSLRVAADELNADAAPSTVEMSYVEVPILLRAGFPGERFLPSVFLGPYAGFLLNCEIQPSGEEGRACDSQDAAERFTPRGTDFGLVAGAGLDMAIGESTIFVDARYTLGLFSIQGGDVPFDARHTGLAVSGGFAVPVGR